MHADLADDTEGTIAQAVELWDRLDLPNVMIKVPATAAGVPAIEELTARGVNVNVTLLFSVERYEQVMEAYLRGLERRAESGETLSGLASVASFFVSRSTPRPMRCWRPTHRCAEGSRSRTPTCLRLPRALRGRSRWEALRSRMRVLSVRSGRARARKTPPTPTCSTSSV